MNNLDLIAMRPLQRALQMTEIGILSNFWQPKVQNSVMKSMPKIMALPVAAKRLYLVSDIGSNVSDLTKQYPDID